MQQLQWKTEMVSKGSQVPKLFIHLVHILSLIKVTQKLTPTFYIFCYKGVKKVERCIILNINILEGRSSEIRHDVSIILSPC